jgi:hypothetical protein
MTSGEKYADALNQVTIQPLIFETQVAHQEPVSHTPAHTILAEDDPLVAADRDVTENWNSIIALTKNVKYQLEEFDRKVDQEADKNKNGLRH